MYLIVGLGNPGHTFAGTRHNIGREIALAAQKKFKFPAFAHDKRLNALIAEGHIGPAPIVLMLPETYVNKSGAAIGPALARYRIKPDRLVIIHDDADIGLGRAKLSFGKRAAGHKGVDSVLRAAKTRGVWRFRIGIAGKRDIPADALVLKKFTPAEQSTARRIVAKTLSALERLDAATPEIIMNTYNR